MIVDSRSATRTRLRRPAGGWTSTSIAAPPIARRAAASAACRSVPARRRSQAMPGASQSGAPASGSAAASAATSSGRALAAAGPAITVITRRHRAASRTASKDTPRLLPCCAPRNDSPFSASSRAKRSNLDEQGNPASPPVILVAGPTASGKSALALELAAAFDGTIINADSLQTYRDLRILSARPDRNGDGPGAAPALRLISMPPNAARLGAGGIGAAGDRRQPSRRQAADRRRRHRALPARAATRRLPRSRRSPPRSARKRRRSTARSAAARFREG